ncbi:MAG: hypothetical protein QJR06_01035 [Alicyclobacillaceae bacterium]|nr:hypothetical protein [Alicyclobacillaceae bacterium]
MMVVPLSLIESIIIASLILIAFLAFLAILAVRLPSGGPRRRRESGFSAEPPDPPDQSDAGG